MYNIQLNDIVKMKFLLHNDPAGEQSGLEHELTVGILGLSLDLVVRRRFQSLNGKMVG